MPRSSISSVVPHARGAARPAVVSVALAVLAALAGCGTSQPVASPGGGADAQSCVLCHGDASRSPASIAPAPPKDTKGNTATTAAGVGAHQRHLQGGAVRDGIACAECHAVPTSISHATQPLQLTWGPIASADGAAPAFDAASLTCANYCHGATMAGGGATAPVWTRVDGTQSTCGSCHGMPPPSPHPAVGGAADGCARCHAGTVRSDGTIDLAGGLHVNGAVDVSGGSCTSCHGDPARQPAAIAAAPPVDVAGNTSTSSPGVGAHERHLRGGSLRSGVACTECHAVPTDASHASQPLQLTWGPLARAGGATPTFDAGSLTCTTYCHGASTPGGATFAPVWNRVDGTQAACGTCHGVPPPAPHPAAGTSLAGCAACHPGTVRPDGTIDVAGGLHVN
ncbi:MAG TPA: CxxxxCH/CxxCH domain-containing protein, partial [Anaeromyxobacteraceae bacterium]|nr:CxxxxCH/CxxCH domain-containing protein [Anaeromyxobacteraceae bacterium]